MNYLNPLYRFSRIWLLHECRRMFRRFCYFLLRDIDVVFVFEEMLVNYNLEVEDLSHFQPKHLYKELNGKFFKLI